MTRDLEKQPRSEHTKQRILDAARQQFARDGYERTTIRSVATEAEIDPSMVMRYFGNKEGLFAAAANFDLRLPNLAEVAPKSRGRELARHFLKIWGEPGGGGFAILLRTAATNESAAQRMRDIFREQVVPAIAAVAPDSAQARAALITTQLLGMAYCRHVLNLPPLAALSPAATVDSIGQSIQRYLDGPIEKAR